jgi:prevent-host-death family protein
MIRLTDAQVVVLSSACARNDGMVFPLTANLKGGAVGNVCKSLLKLGLIEEIPATDHNTVWRHDEERGPITLRATPLAQSTLGITEPEVTTKAAETVTAPVQRRKGTKQEALIEMLRAPGGATIEEIATALEWAAHTVRGAMAGPLKRKLGLEVTSEKVEGRGRVYAVKQGPRHSTRIGKGAIFALNSMCAGRPAMNITKDISPLTEFKRDSARLIAQIRETGRPQILTVNGKPSVVVMDAAAWQEMQDQLDYAKTVAGIRKGLTQARAGEGTDAGTFFDGLAQTK